MSIKARAFFGWVQSTTTRLKAFRGWALDIFIVPNAPSLVASTIPNIEYRGITTIPDNNYTGIVSIPQTIIANVQILKEDEVV
jgi:hypothetical protein